MRRGSWTLALALSFVVTVALSPTLALAADTASCSDYGYVNRADGYVTDNWSNHRHGIRANLDRQYLHLCTNPRPGEGSGSFAWVGIQGPPTSLPYNIVQVGIGECRAPSPTSCLGDLAMRDIWAYGLDPSAPGCSGYAQVMPTVHLFSTFSAPATYTVQHYSSGDYWITIDSSVVEHLPPGTVCWTNDSAAVITENWDYGDALGGTSSDPFYFTAEQFETSPLGSWLNLPSLCDVRLGAYGHPLESVFKCVAPGSSTIYTYTLR